MFEIIKGNPIPSSSKQTGLTKTLRKMECMDSIVIPENKRSSVNSCATQAGIKIRTSSNKDGTVTVWRTDGGATSSGAADPSLEPTSVSTPVPTFYAPGYPKIERTVASPDMGLPEGYYIQEDYFGPRIWIQGQPPASKLAPPTPAPKPDPHTPAPPVPTSTKTIFD
jgi:hypothetical protein